jgi:HemY protein
VRGWLAKALGASRGPAWVCDKCAHIHAAWVPVCENCGAFDTLEWKTPPHGEDAAMASSAMLPLLVGDEPEPEPAPEPEPEPEPESKPAPEAPPAAAPAPSTGRAEAAIDDAELASVADRARATGG